MYQEITLHAKNIGLQGYHWEATNPKAVICLLHGIGEYSGRYDKIGEYFIKSNYSLLAMDLRGHGKSQGKRGHAAPRKSIFEDIDALIRLAEQKYPNIPIYLYGHSMGGNIGLDYRRDGLESKNLAGYIITAPWLTLYKKLPAALVLFARLLSVVKPDYLMNTGLSAKDLAHVESEVKAYTSDPLVHKKISVLTAINGLDAADKILAGASNNNKPMLLMHGTEDKICTTEGSKRVYALEKDHCTYIEWTGSYHEIHNEANSDQVMSAMLAWLSERD